jgi:formiminoglutamase
MSWPRITDLIVTDGPAEIALLGAPLKERSVTPARYDLAPDLVRQTLRRFSTYDVETGEELGLRVRDQGNVPVQALTPGEAFEPIRDAADRCVSRYGLTLLLGGHNGITRPAAHALGVPLSEVGLVTLDAHFDLRETDEGPMNGNPISWLLEDGLPGANICQIGLSPFANSPKMHRVAKEAGVGVYTIADVKGRGIIPVLEEALARLGRTTALMVDFDIDVIDRSQCPGAPGARPGGMPVDQFLAAARHLGAQEKVRLVDLTEFDPALDLSEITALTAGRWACEVLAGYSSRSRC